ncbi:MAG TPA: DUF3566 domain-containing protein [Steroidobacteraceae bacterium]|nr:DUF3566 domain-containing protein [Steroidobacteraceae bacterium]
MSKRISRIAPWQAGKLFALIYFGLSLAFVILFELANLLAPLPEGSKPHMSVAVLFLVPFLYALAGLIFVPLACWIYNTAAAMVGGLEITLTDDPG